MKKLFYIILLSLFLSCTKEKENSNPPKSNTELLVNKKWKISSISGKLPDGTVYPDEYSPLPSYQKDDYWLFKADLTFTYNDNTDMYPGSASPIIDSGTWFFVNNDQYLMLTSTMSMTPFPIKVLELTNSSLRFESTDATTGATIWTGYTVIP